jgi:hypothetical protein
MKVLGGLLMVLAVVLAIVPQYGNCEAHGGMMPSSETPGTVAASGALASTDTLLADAQTAAAAPTMPKMRCLWTARAAIAVAIPLFVVGAFMLFSRRKETLRVLGIMATLLGLLSILLPTVLIGTCKPDTAVCNTTEKPTMLIIGGIAMAIGLVAIVLNEMRRGDTPEGSERVEARTAA